MHRPEVELAISRSQVRRPNHYTTEPDGITVVRYVYYVEPEFNFQSDDCAAAVPFQLMPISRHFRDCTAPLLVASYDSRKQSCTKFPDLHRYICYWQKDKGQVLTVLLLVFAYTVGLS